MYNLQCAMKNVKCEIDKIKMWCRRLEPGNILEIKKPCMKAYRVN
jgi:hypothetical protein